MYIMAVKNLLSTVPKNKYFVDNHWKFPMKLNVFRQWNKIFLILSRQFVWTTKLSLPIFDHFCETSVFNLAWNWKFKKPGIDYWIDCWNSFQIYSRQKLLVSKRQALFSHIFSHCPYKADSFKCFIMEIYNIIVIKKKLIRLVR